MPEVEAKKTGVQHFFAAFRYSCQGFAAAFKGEAAIRQEVFLGLLTVPLGLYLSIPLLLKLLVVLVWLFLLATELLNSALEAIVDLVSPEYNKFAKIAKDAGSAAVFCMLCSYGATWFAILITLLKK